MVGRRRALALAGAGLVAGPALAALSSGRAEAAAAAPAAASTAPSTVKAYGTRAMGQRIAPMEIQRRAV
ncbi:MAG TPA: hydroxyacid dehydrogenase, partial [Stenotrophomonas sp.]|nr:hydroxyacid dehydrogenase [Stenotrophomonas sp.]